MNRVKEMQNNITFDDIFHGNRVAEISMILAKNLNIKESERYNTVIAASYHDIGKCCIPSEVLTKKGSLKREEWDEIKLHSEFGAAIISLKGYDDEIVRYILHHHENMDGSGYHGGLKGVEIPIGSRIIRIADVYDALREKRPYKRSFSHSEAIEQMKKEIDKFDKEIFEIFLSNQIKIREIYKRSDKFNIVEEEYIAK